MLMHHAFTMESFLVRSELLTRIPIKETSAASQKDTIHGKRRPSLDIKLNQPKSRTIS